MADPKLPQKARFRGALPADKAKRALLPLLMLAGGLVALAGRSTSANAGAVTGKVSGIKLLVNSAWAEAKDPKRHRYTWREPSPTVRAKFRKLYAHGPKDVCVVATGSAKAKPFDKPIGIKLTGGRTSFVTLAVAPGTTVEFANVDPFPHRTYVTHKGKTVFQPLDIKSRATRKWRIPGPGVYEIRDQLFPSVRSWLVVEPKLAGVAYPNLKDSFTFANLAAGEYTLQGYHQGKPVGEKLKIKVTAAPKQELKEVLVVKKAPAKKKGKLAMLASRFWYVLSGLAIGVLVFALYISASMFDRTSKRAMSDGLTGDAQVVSWYLKADARKRSSALINFALDPHLAQALAKIDEKPREVDSKSAKVAQGVVDKAAERLPKTLSFTAIFAVDRYGRVVARKGFEEASGNKDFNLGGFPVVADALHGWVRDDKWVLDGRVYMVVARPVEGDTSKPPAGAIVGVQILDNVYAKALATRTGAAIAFFAGGTRVSSAAPEGFDQSRMDVITSDIDKLKDDKDYQKNGISKVRIVNNDVGLIYARLPGEAWDLGAGYVVGRSALLVGGPMGFLSKGDDADKQAVNWGMVALGTVLTALVGLIFSFLEHSRPISVFRAEAELLAKGEVDHLAPSKFRGVFRKIAAEINDGIEKVVVKGGGSRKAADLDEVLGPIDDQPSMSAFSFPGDATPDLAPAAEPAPKKVQPPAPKPKKVAPPPPAGAGPKKPIKPPPPGGAKKPPPPKPGGEDDATVVGKVPSGVMKAAGADDTDAEWQKVYEDFVALKEKNGENTKGLTYAKFEKTLRKNRDALVARHNCSRVKFTVYLKDGKAALKASPVK